MEFINRDPLAHTKRKVTGKPELVILERILYFNLASVEFAGLKDHHFAHFINDAGWFYFYVDTQANGFALRRYKVKSGFLVYSSKLVKHLEKLYGVKVGQRFKIKETSREYDGCKLYQLIF